MHNCIVLGCWQFYTKENAHCKGKCEAKLSIKMRWCIVLGCAVGLGALRICIAERTRVVVSSMKKRMIFC